MKRPVWQYFLAIFAVFVLLRVPLFWIPVIDVDEAIYALFSRIWFDGGIPYVDCVETKPLGIYFLYGLIFKLTGPFNMFAVHMVTTVWMFATSYVLYLIVKMFGSKRAGIFAGLFYAVFTTTYIPKIIATTIEPIMMLPLSLQIYLWLKHERTKNMNFAFVSGVMLSVAMLFKYQAGMNLILMVLFLLIGFRRENLKGFFFFCLGLVPLPLMMLGYLYKIDALDAFLYWTISGSLSYIGEGSSNILLGKQLLTRVLPFMASTALLWVLLVKKFVRLPRERIGREQLFIVLWFLLSIVPVSTGLRFYGHYFIILVPALCILSAVELDRLWDDLPRLVKKIVVVSTVIIAIGFTIPRFYLDKLYAKVHEDNPNDYAPIAEYINEHTTASDKIAVWGFGPLIYWYSERLPAIRFFWSDLLVGRVPGAKPTQDHQTVEFSVAWQMFFEDMQKNKPIYFIDTSPAGLHDYENFPINEYPVLEKYLSDNYEKVAAVNEAIIYLRK